MHLIQSRGFAPLAVAMAMFLAACPDRAGDPARDTVAPDVAEAAQTHMDAATGDQEMSRAVREYRLTMPLMQQYVQAVRNLHQLERTDPELRRRMEAMGEHEERSLAEVTGLIEGEPQLRRAIEDAGLTVRDYMLISLAFMQSMMAHEFQRQGYIQELPPEVSAENVAFIRDNEQQLQPLMDELNRLGEEGGG